MAFVGLEYAVFAPIKTEVSGQAIEYDAGVVIGAAIGANITLTRNDEALYADNAIVESDNSLTGGTIDINVDDMTDEAQEKVLGLEKAEDDDHYELTGAPTPYGGFGIIRKRRKGNKTTYVAFWYHKIQLGITSESMSTQQERTTYQTPTLSGKLMGVKNDASMKTRFRAHETFETVAEAYAWINGRANIAAAASA